jgi:(p)ppGpp synthase/HD superfamily hydrolase
MDIEAASRTAEDAHRGQTRAHGAPYVDHPRAVLRFTEALAIATGFPLDDELRAVALLHDVIEDSDHTEESLLPVFGERVARMVAALSKPPKSNGHSKEQRSDTYWTSLVDADDGARLVKTADRLHNVFELPQTNDPARQSRDLLATRDDGLPFSLAAASP